MIRFFVALILFFSSALAVAQPAEERMLSLTSQDKNGLFIVSAISTGRKTRISIMEFSPKNPGETQMLSYPSERFDELWLALETLDLEPFRSSNPDDIGAAANYVIAVGTGDDPSRDLYLVPKCSAPEAIVLFVKRLTEGFLPEGSPGLKRPCPENSEQAEG